MASAPPPSPPLIIEPLKGHCEVTCATCVAVWADGLVHGLTMCSCGAGQTGRCVSGDESCSSSSALLVPRGARGSPGLDKSQTLSRWVWSEAREPTFQHLQVMLRLLIWGHTLSPEDLIESWGHQAVRGYWQSLTS